MNIYTAGSCKYCLSLHSMLCGLHARVCVFYEIDSSVSTAKSFTYTCFLTHFIGLDLFVKFLNGRNVLAVNVDNNGSIS